MTEAEQRAERRRGALRPSRRATVLAGLVAAAALLGSTRLTWAHAEAADLAGSLQTVAVTGADAAPEVTAVALVALAGSVATALSSRWVRLVTGPVLILAGVLAAVSTIGVLLDATAASSAAVAQATGMIGAQSQATTTAWAPLSLLPALAVAAVGATVLAVGARWPVGTRYRRATVAVAADPADDPAAAWDALTRGVDPSLDADAGPADEEGPEGEHDGAHELGHRRPGP